jgi:hypothetical protein
MIDRALHWMGHDNSSKQAEAMQGDDARATTGGGGPGQGMGPVCIGVVEGPLRAEIARTYLEQAGITVHLQSEPLGSIYGLVSGPLGAVRVLVPAAQAEEAERVFAELDFSDEAPAK